MRVCSRILTGGRPPVESLLEGEGDGDMVVGWCGGWIGGENVGAWGVLVCI